MIRSITAAGAVLLLLGCDGKRDVQSSVEVPGDIYPVTVREHAYIVWNNSTGYAGMGGICHDEACPNPIHQCPPCP